MNYLEIRKSLMDKFNELDARDEIVSMPRSSINRETGEMILFGIIARKTGGRYFYPPEIAQMDKLLLIKLVRQTNYNSTSFPVAIEYPYRDPDLENMWECMFDVWVKPEKKYRYGIKFLKFIKKHLLNAKLPEAKYDSS